MNREQIYKILRAISLELSATDDSFLLLPETPDWSASLESLQIDLITGQEYFRQLETRIPTKKFHVSPALLERLHLFKNLGELCDHLAENSFEPAPDGEIVYVDDEEENLFVFKRKYGKVLKLRTFQDSLEALDYIVKTPNVALVITDEVMPKLGGNELCDEVHKSKPMLKFILITGNPNHDGDLMYRSLKSNRFYDFINKPVDFDAKGGEYLEMIQGLIKFG